jgi:hypothetical protein
MANIFKKYRKAYRGIEVHTPFRHKFSCGVGIQIDIIFIEAISMMISLSLAEAHSSSDVAYGANIWREGKAAGPTGRYRSRHWGSVACLNPLLSGKPVPSLIAYSDCFASTPMIGNAVNGVVDRAGWNKNAMHP